MKRPCWHKSIPAARRSLGRREYQVRASFPPPLFCFLGRYSPLSFHFFFSASREKENLAGVQLSSKSQLIANQGTRFPAPRARISGTHRHWGALSEIAVDLCVRLVARKGPRNVQHCGRKEARHQRLERVSSPLRQSSSIIKSPPASSHLPLPTRTPNLPRAD